MSSPGRKKYNSINFYTGDKIFIEDFKKIREEIPIRYGVRITKPKLKTWQDGFSNLFNLFVKRVNS